MAICAQGKLSSKYNQLIMVKQVVLMPGAILMTKRCWQEVQDVNRIYYDTILDACNGNQACVSLQALNAYLPDCSEYSDYVELFYRCITGEFTHLTFFWV